MPGASGDPVRFANPFQRITEVGWSSRYIVIPFNIRRKSISVWGVDDITCADPEPVMSSDLWVETWLAGLEYLAPAPTTYYTVSQDRMGGSSSLQSGESIAGLPDVTISPSYGPWQWAGHNNASIHDGLNIPTTIDASGFGHSHMNAQRWEPITGSPVLSPSGKPIKVLGTNSAFVQSTSATFFSLGIACIDNEPRCIYFPEGGLSTARKMVYAGSPSDIEDMEEGSGPTLPETTLTLDFNGVTAVIKGRTYKQVGLQVATADNSDPKVKNTGSIYVLCERETA